MNLPVSPIFKRRRIFIEVIPTSVVLNGEAFIKETQDEGFSQKISQKKELQKKLLEQNDRRFRSSKKYFPHQQEGDSVNPK